MKIIKIELYEKHLFFLACFLGGQLTHATVEKEEIQKDFDSIYNKLSKKHKQEIDNNIQMVKANSKLIMQTGEPFIELVDNLKKKKYE